MVTSDNPRIFTCRCRTTWSNLGERRQECPACHQRCWDERPLPATVRFTAKMEPCQQRPEHHIDRSGYCLPEDPGHPYLQGYPT